ncbi:MAG: hypothetical protein K2M73_06970 [Lachnospiraceae bacterium]|nr:hypothetical protein [Lachnospiraceae bacterium]
MSSEYEDLEKQKNILREKMEALNTMHCNIENFKEDLNLYWCSSEMKYINIKIEKIIKNIDKINEEIEELNKELKSISDEQAEN